jgi:hypothetical protein
MLLFVLFIGVFFLMFLILPDVGFSEQENREMTQAPKFTLEALFGDKFTTKFESYTTDQFPFRDSWTTIKARSEFVSGKKENKGVFLCAGDTLVEAYKTPDAAQLKTNVDAVRSLSESAGVPVYFCLVPGIAEVRPGILPTSAPNDSQTETIEYAYENSGAVNIDLLSSLRAHADEYIFYRTDHHWTSLGAYYGYTAIMEAMGRQTTALSSYERQVVSREFYGTVYSKSGISWVKPDAIEIFANQALDTRVFNYVSGESKETPMYDFAFLEKKDKYSMFMGGITPLIKVTSGNSQAPSLLIIRDSYTDSLIPFMQGDFSEIHVMDLRYYKAQLYESTVAGYVRENGIDSVLVCYSMFNFGTDVNVFLMG